MAALSVCAHDAARTLAERLERGEVEHFPVCPFPLPQGHDRSFLMEQRLGGGRHKNVSYDPRTGRAAGFVRRSPAQVERLRTLLAAFSEDASAWLARVLPPYAGVWRLDRATLRPEEEATRNLRLKARNDLLHLDAFPSRPTNGWRILRLFVNINPTEPRVWVTSESFARLLERYGEDVGFPARHGPGWARRLGRQAVRLFYPAHPLRSPYDTFMLRFHNFLKANDEFQERSRKRFWSFQPEAAWLAFTDTVSHAVLRGRFALEHSYFVPPDALALPAESPAALLAQICGTPRRNRAA
jgi:hypothetical protein